MADRTILDLTTDTDRPVVKIDGIGYPLRTTNDLTLEHFRFLERVSGRVGELLQRAGKLTPVENAELEKRLIEIAGVALEAPRAVLRKLQPIQRVMVFKVFMELLTPTLIQALRATAPDQAAAIEKALASSGVKLFPGSSGSTAAPRKRGRARRRG